MEFFHLKEMSFEKESTLLVPYSKEFVPAYNDYMKDEELQKATNSEPLTLKEEEVMQQKYMKDPNMYCFIMTLNKKMIGDINVLLSDEEPEAELSVMVCDKENRRKGHARRAVELMIENFKGKTFIAKINMDNQASIAMFKKLGFIETDRSDVFKEVTLTL